MVGPHSAQFTLNDFDGDKGTRAHNRYSKRSQDGQILLVITDIELPT